MFHRLQIINTAAAAMMLPIADAILEETFPSNDDSSTNSSSYELQPVSPGNGNANGGPDINENEESVTVARSNGNKKNTRMVQRSPGLEVVVLTPDDDKSSSPTESEIVTLKKMFYLSIAYSANIGGTSTLTSNGPNLILRFVVDSRFSAQTPLDYANWFLLNAPAAIVTVVCVWFTFRQLYFRRVRLPKNILGAKDAIEKKYRDLGPMK